MTNYRFQMLPPYWYHFLYYMVTTQLLRIREEREGEVIFNFTLVYFILMIWHLLVGKLFLLKKIELGKFFLPSGGVAFTSGLEFLFYLLHKVKLKHIRTKIICLCLHNILQISEENLALLV